LSRGSRTLQEHSGAPGIGVKLEKSGNGGNGWKWTGGNGHALDAGRIIFFKKILKIL
jgi:hypothetical protein